jgi:hypothetical protein
MEQRQLSVRQAENRQQLGSESKGTPAGGMRRGNFSNSEPSPSSYSYSSSDGTKVISTGDGLDAHEVEGFSPQSFSS